MKFDHLLPKSYRRDVVSLYRGRILVCLLLLSAFYWATWSVATFFYHSLSHGSFEYPIVLFCVFLLQILLIYLFAKHEQYYIGVFFTLAPLAIQSLWVGYMAGTAQGATPLLLFFALAIMLFTLLPLRVAIGLISILAFIHINYSLLPVTVGEIPATFARASDPTAWAIPTTLSVALIYFVLIVTLSIFWNMNRRLSEQLIVDNQLLERMSDQDHLTKLANRRYFRKYLNKVLHQASFANKPFSIVYVDLDGFKSINDTHGHDAGDNIIVVVAKRIVASVRGEDFVARMGGDEFAIVLDGIKGDKVKLICKKIENRINQAIPFEDKKLNIGGSIGIACYPEDSEEISTLIRMADHAMYASKARGGGISFAHDCMISIKN